MEEVEVGKVVQTLLGTYPRQQRVVDVKFLNLDVNYLQRRTGLTHKFVGRMLRSFGEGVVLESLRRLAVGYQYAPGREEAVFVGICRNVQAAGGGLAPRDAAAARPAGLQSPPASPPEET